MKVNMAEGPSTTATLSNQFVVKCSVCGHHVYKHIWSPHVGEPFETFARRTGQLVTDLSTRLSGSYPGERSQVHKL